MKNKRGGDKIISVYWFVILFLVAGAVVYMATLFYGTPYDAREIEAEVLTNKIADCLAQGGYLNEDIFFIDNAEDFLERCDLNFEVEDEYDWAEQEQYYVEVHLYEFDEDSVDGIGEQVSNLEIGNVNLKTSWVLDEAEDDDSDKEFIVIHYTAGYSAEGAIQSLVTNELSVHYMIERDGTVISSENVGELGIEGAEDVFKEEDETAQHVGCIDGRTGEKRDSCEEKNEIPDGGEKCCVDLNEESIGIELVNLGYLCGDDETCKTERGVEISEEDWEEYVATRYDDETIKGLIWEEFSDAQIDALVELVADVAARNNIPLDRDYIVGHDETSPGYKWDPGPAFPWDEFMERLEEESSLSSTTGRSFYVLDEAGNQYVIQILSIVGKTEKNV